MRFTFLFAIISLLNVAAAAPIPGKRSPENIFLNLPPDEPNFQPPKISWSFFVPSSEKVEITQRIIEEHLASAKKDDWEDTKLHLSRVRNWTGALCKVTRGWHRDASGAEVADVEYKTKDTSLRRTVVPRKYVAISGGEECFICKDIVFKMTSMCLGEPKRHDDICLHCYGKWCRNKNRNKMGCPFCRGPIHNPNSMMVTQTRDCGEGPPTPPGCLPWLKASATDCWKGRGSRVRPEKKAT